MKLRQPHSSERCQFQRIIPADEDYKCNVSFAVPVKDFFYAGRQSPGDRRTPKNAALKEHPLPSMKIISHTQIRIGHKIRSH